MATLTTAWANIVYDLVNRAVAPPALTGVYLRLFTADPGAAGSFTSEVTGGSYAAQNIVAAMGAPAAGVGTSTTAVTFAGMPAVTVTHWGKCRSASGTGAGEMIERGAFVAPVVITAGQSFVISVGDLDSVAS